LLASLSFRLHADGHAAADEGVSAWVSYAFPPQAARSQLRSQLEAISEQDLWWDLASLNPHLGSFPPSLSGTRGWREQVEHLGITDDGAASTHPDGGDARLRTVARAGVGTFFGGSSRRLTEAEPAPRPGTKQGRFSVLSAERLFELLPTRFGPFESWRKLSAAGGQGATILAMRNIGNGIQRRCVVKLPLAPDDGLQNEI